MKGRYFTFFLITLLGVSTPAFAQTLVIFKNARSIEVDSVRYENNQCIYTKNGSERRVSLGLIEEIYVLNKGRIYPPTYAETKKSEDISITNDKEESVEQTQIYKPPLGNAQEVSASDPEMVRLQIANALRAGDIDLALKGFDRSKKSQTIIPAFDAAQRNQLADWIEKGQLTNSGENYRAYTTEWTDEQGKVHNMNWTMGRDNLGQWRIISW